jgi:hypothetical protein
VSEAWRRRLELPTYQVREAARLAQVAPQTVAGWFYGYPGSRGARAKAVFSHGKERRVPLSYLQLVEVAFVASCRRQRIPMKNIRVSHRYLAEAFQTEFPFADVRLKTVGPHILFERAGEHSQLIAADLEGQVGWRDFLLDRIAEFDYEGGVALRWHPRGRGVPVVVDPRMNFGSPFLESSGLATWAVADAFLTSGTLADVELDLGLGRGEILVALAFEGIEVAKAA